MYCIIIKELSAKSFIMEVVKRWEKTLELHDLYGFLIIEMSDIGAVRIIFLKTILVYSVRNGIISRLLQLWLLNCWRYRIMHIKAVPLPTNMKGWIRCYICKIRDYAELSVVISLLDFGDLPSLHLFFLNQDNRRIWEKSLLVSN